MCPWGSGSPSVNGYQLEILEIFLCLTSKNGRIFNSNIKTFHLNYFYLFITFKKSFPRSPFLVFSHGKAWNQGYSCDYGPTGVPGPNHPSMFQWIRPWPWLRLIICRVLNHIKNYCRFFRLNWTNMSPEVKFLSQNCQTMIYALFLNSL